VDLAAMLSELIVASETPGAAVGFVDGTERTVVTAGGRGLGRGPVDGRTIFAAASLTKPLFAFGVMRLVDEGVLDLDQPLSRYLPEPLAGSDDRSASITARMTLSHTTGFPNWREGSDDRVHPSDTEVPLRWAPGTRWGYSGEGISYLQRVIEQLTATPIADVLADVVLRPLGMADSTFASPGGDEPRLAIGHDRDGAACRLFAPPAAKAAAGGLFTTVSDYLRFLNHCLDHEQRMFVEQMQIDDELAWGLGWGIERGDERSVWQWGDDPGYKNFVIATPSLRRGLVVFTNGDRGAHVYAAIVRELLPGPHPSLEVWGRPGWLRGWASER